MDIPLIEQAKIQAQVLVPLVKALQAELGEERANALVRKALGDRSQVWRALVEEAGRARPWREDGLGLRGLRGGGCARLRRAQEGRAVLRGERHRLSLRRVLQEVGAPELGFLLVCSSDFALAEGYSDPVHLDRTQTIMQGATHCDSSATSWKSHRGSAVSGAHCRSAPLRGARQARDPTPPHPEEHREAMRLERWEPVVLLPPFETRPCGPLLRVRLSG